MSRRFLEVAGHRLHIRTWNDDSSLPVIVLVHGLIVSSRYFMKLGESLSSTHRVLAIDLPGHGWSSKPRPYLGTQAMGRVLAVALDGLDVHDVTVVANSYGCPITTEAALTDSSRINSLIFIGPTMDLAGRHSLGMLLRFGRSVWREPLWATGVTVADLAQCGVFRAFSEGFDMCRYRLEERLPKLSVPVTFLRGEHDHVAPPSWLQSVSSAIGAGDVHTVANAAHEPHAKKPNDVASIVRQVTGQRPSGKIKFE